MLDVAANHVGPNSRKVLIRHICKHGSIITTKNGWGRLSARAL